MDISAFEIKLKSLLNEVSNIPAARSSKTILLSAKARSAKSSNTTATLEDSLEQLQLMIKYLIFDVEATRRENQYLRKVLESRED
jgi:hypothetical protein